MSDPYAFMVTDEKMAEGLEAAEQRAIRVLKEVLEGLE